MKTLFKLSLAALVLVLTVAVSYAVGISEEISVAAVTLGQGFRPYMLEHLKQIAGTSTPMMKLEPVGFLNLLKRQSSPIVLNNPRGHQNTVQVKYKQRFTPDFTDTSKSCDNVVFQTWDETSVDLASTRQIAIHLDDEKVAKYEDDASRTVRLGLPATDFMNECLSDIMSAADALLSAVDQDLLTIAAAEVGVNRVNGLATAKTVNLNQDTSNLQLNDGITEILHDYKRNQAQGRPQIMGSGLLYAYVLQQFAKGMAQNGLDSRVMANAFDFYHDMNAQNILGANQVIVYEPNAVQLVEYLEYTGFKAGAKPGASTFGVLSLPMGMGTDILPVDFDFQLKYRDCAETVTDGYYGTSLTLEKGFTVILSKQCGLFTIPDDAYRATDVLNGNRGSYLYNITNNCETC